MTRTIPATLALLAALTAPAAAQWRYDPAQAAATSYCAERAAGKSHRAAADVANGQLYAATNGTLAGSIATVLTSGRDAMQRAKYIASKMCPEFYSMNGPVEPAATTTPESAPSAN